MIIGFTRNRIWRWLTRDLAGIAVSGGADSMALAYLCKQLECSPELSEPISVTAFVVDHRARPESTIEAEKVAGWLRDMSMTSLCGFGLKQSNYTLRHQNSSSQAGLD